ncbi:MFS transporter [Streptomyces sp. NPDC005805]|uniref:MFS transporter n=1 Tax=Streptomyces sp. NPDC005805 TaxID=3157068 RepID=UPI003400CFEE
MPGVMNDFRRTQLAIAALFCFLGFQYATWAARLPALKTQLGLSEVETGVLLTACGAGAAASFPLVTLLMRRLGSRRLALLSALCLMALLLALAAAPNYPVALLVICADGVAVGCLNVAMNAQGAALEKAHGRAAMAQLHATFSAGSFLAALVAAGMHLVTPGVVQHFAVAAVLLLVLLGCARARLLPDAASEEQPTGTKDAAGTKEASGRRRLTAPTRITLWLGAAMVCGTVAEGSMNDWSALYLEDVAGAPAQLAPMGIAVVSVMMVLARLLGDGWRERWGDARVVRVGSTVAGAGLALALLAGGVVPALIGFACMGLGIAAVTPCLYVAAAAEGPSALALVASLGTTGLLAGPAVIGFVAGAADLRWGMGVVAAAALLVPLCTARIRWGAAAGKEAPAAV